MRLNFPADEARKLFADFAPGLFDALKNRPPLPDSKVMFSKVNQTTENSDDSNSYTAEDDLEFDIDCSELDNISLEDELPDISVAVVCKKSSEETNAPPWKKLNIDTIIKNQTDIWMPRDKKALESACALFNSDLMPSESVCLLFYSGKTSDEIAVLDFCKPYSPIIRACENHYLDELCSKKIESKRFLLVPAPKLRPNQQVLLVNEIHECAAQNVDISYSFGLLNHDNARYVLFESNNATLMNTHMPIKPLDKFYREGKLHIVLINLRQQGGMITDDTHPIKSGLETFVKKSEQFYVKAWRHASL